MSSQILLCSWKEIAAYMGKGVRTVQRWERELGLPIRRPGSAHSHVVLAVQDEIDNWILSQGIREITEGNELKNLRQRVKALEAENEQLRALNELRASKKWVQAVMEA